MFNFSLLIVTMGDDKELIKPPEELDLLKDPVLNFYLFGNTVAG